MAVEGENSVLSLECSIDLSSTTRNKIECHWFEEIFLDENDQDLQLPARSSVFAWVRTGHSADGSPASQLPYEFALLYLEDTRGKIIETRVGVGLRRVPGTGFPTERAIEAICSTSERVVFARSGGDLLVFKLENDGWTWKMDGVLNTTLVD